MSSFLNKAFTLAAAPVRGAYTLAKLGAQQIQQGQTASGAMTLSCSAVCAISAAFPALLLVSGSVVPALVAYSVGAVVSRELTRLSFSTDEPPMPR
jgi:ABC-type branched-subunit amino acid transport system permease subunit